MVVHCTANNATGDPDKFIKDRRIRGPERSELTEASRDHSKVRIIAVAMCSWAIRSFPAQQRLPTSRSTGATKCLERIGIPNLVAASAILDSRASLSRVSTEAKMAPMCLAVSVKLKPLGGVVGISPGCTSLPISSTRDWRERWATSPLRHPAVVARLSRLKRSTSSSEYKRCFPPSVAVCAPRSDISTPAGRLCSDQLDSQQSVSGAQLQREYCLESPGLIAVSVCHVSLFIANVNELSRL